MTAKQAVHLLINARWIIPVVPANRVFEDCALVIHRQKIIALVPQAEARKRFEPEQAVNLDRHIVIPGLINAHGHAAMNLLRGYADDFALQTWLNDHIWPAEAEHVDAEFVHDGTELAIAEMIKSGTTCFADMYFFPEQAAQVARKAHMRAQITFPILDFPTSWGQGPDDYFAKGLALHDEYRADDLIRIGFGPHAPYTVSDPHLAKVATLAEELQAPIQIHLHETVQEVDDAYRDTGVRPIERLYQLGLLTPQTQCVHMTQLNDDDIQTIANSGAHVIHCPESNLKLASGFCPVAKLQEAGVNVALGTDGAASNNNLNMLEEIQTAALLAKAVSRDPAALNAHQALACATLCGAKALGIDDITGSLEVGKAADIVALQADDTSALPIYDPASALAYNNRALKVSHVWVAGRALLLSGHLQTLDERDIRARTEQWQAKIKPVRSQP
ncbi:TRZ/ATZ family hydrolase [Gilvimarinus xylanilyticus]|uniref:5-methylthioadenosine/S-adenosylhomocysteine deaminase n=1 Tax=Gilvimarinus xylanilyticus TaxID=2944139 RepID=A0A9X2HVD4_9GAMM|nr:TRZ/ATZ family hydrolase [Gilvimarinus xylanilyticus]MCP8898354.1 TRZ/ATZ family hydrolase [Gilvimarinus xylanilyticus]